MSVKNSDNTDVTFGNLYEDGSLYVGQIDVGGTISIGALRNVKGGEPTDLLTLSVANADGTETVVFEDDDSGSYTVTGDEIAIYIDPHQT